jgi:hypothetical protein
MSADVFRNRRAILKIDDHHSRPGLPKAFGDLQANATGAACDKRIFTL